MHSSTIPTSSTARVDFRTTREVKSLIEQAAALNGMTVSEFIKIVMIEKSREVIDREHLRILSDRDRDFFMSLIEAPPAPNGALLKAAANFKQAVEKGALTP